ncbi:GSCOCG00013271001-RA-CDS [Cotesia congregata]|uniref:Uncharacterized protein n=1 Tax=Cotesia congregata TaxID=51543 RepID=A0A8J2HF85_COTCN|nr:GSCOCG00013271001-RA-CDS [Cotesia congregata]CAG5094043.1 Protein of unknown function [Cotesia congregata]
MWSIYLIFISMLAARESLSENNLKKRQIVYPLSPNVYVPSNFYGNPFEKNFPPVYYPSSHYFPNEFAYRLFWITPAPVHDETANPFINSRDNFNTPDDKTGGSARKSAISVIVEKKEQKNDTDSARKSGGDEKLSTNVTVQAKLDDRSNDTLATGPRLEVEISSDNSTDTRIENKNSTTA